MLLSIVVRIINIVIRYFGCYVIYGYNAEGFWVNITNDADSKTNLCF